MAKSPAVLDGRSTFTCLFIAQVQRRSKHETALKEEVLLTPLTEAEYTINARPLTHAYQWIRPSPTHSYRIIFCLGNWTYCLLPKRVRELIDVNGERAQALVDSFWRKCVREYLPHLILRGSPTDSTKNLAVGDLVLIVDSTLLRNVWPRGEIVTIHPGTCSEYRGPNNLILYTSNVTVSPTKFYSKWSIF